MSYTAPVERVAGALLRTLYHRDEWTTRGELRSSLAARDRHLFEDAMGSLVVAGQIEEEDGWRTGVHYYRPKPRSRKD